MWTFARHECLPIVRRAILSEGHVDIVRLLLARGILEHCFELDLVP